jgi:molecular chaperone GrpE (heat shock protein)
MDPGYRASAMPLPVFWSAWSGKEQSLWAERQELLTKSLAATEQLQATLSEEQQCLLRELADADNTEAALRAQQILERCRRMLPHLADALTYAIDAVDMLHSEGAEQPVGY